MRSTIASGALFAAAAAVLHPALRGEVKPNVLFSDHAVLQQGRVVPVWGTAKDGEKITVDFAGQHVTTTTRNGNWSLTLKPLVAGGPFTMTISGENKVTIADLLVGEVWVCSGQSNMERQLGPRLGQSLIVSWEQEVATAHHPQIRHFGVAQKTAVAPLASVEGRWVVCSPETVADFTAVGYFFARELQRARPVPIGLIHSSWGGTPAEAWTSLPTLRTLPEFTEPVARLDRAAAQIREGTYDYSRQISSWYQENDIGSSPTSPWNAPDADLGGWTEVKLPAFWEDEGLPAFDGVVWFRRSVELPPGWAGRDLVLHLGAVDDADTTWVNAVPVGATSGWRVPRVYRVPAAALRPGRNVIAVRVLDTGGGGGIWGGPDPMRLIVAGDDAGESISLTGSWWRKESVSFARSARPPPDFTASSIAPGMLYNGMIAPLQPYAIRGVIWYQGEANVGREKQYRTLFPAMIADWRQAWKQGEPAASKGGVGNFPFLFVQIAPFREMTPEIREAQLLTWRRTPDTAMVVTIDCGDANDIHPANKQPVGARLALAARAVAYGEAIEFSGPVFDSMRVEAGRAVLRFTHLGGGLLAPGGTLIGFTIAGADRSFHPARAEIQGDTVVVSADAVTRPATVRYGWANVPVGNLFNRAGLPASPFRTDDEE